MRTYIIADNPARLRGFATIKNAYFFNNDCSKIEEKPKQCMKNVNRNKKCSDFGKIDCSDFGNSPSSKNENKSAVTVL